MLKRLTIMTAARLQPATVADPEEDPILVWVEQEAGHGQDKPLRMRIRDNADMLSFAAWQLGLDLHQIPEA